jgi:precorrin-6B methylase 1
MHRLLTPEAAAVKITGETEAIPLVSASTAAAARMRGAFMMAPFEMNCRQAAAVRLGAQARPHKKMLMSRLRSSNHTDATATMLNEPAPRTSRG